MFNPSIFDKRINTLVETFKDWSWNDSVFKAKELTSLSDFRHDCLKEGGWVDKLESGEYRQTQNLLKLQEENGSNKYCCLGVYAEEVLCKNPYQIQAADGEELLDYFYIPKEVQSVLSGMNDIDNFSFPMIAYVIKEAFKKLDEQTKADTTPDA